MGISPHLPRRTTDAQGTPPRLACVKPIESGELLLHVGVHKTGTTALQAALADARADLPRYDVAYPGSGTFQHGAILAGAGRSYGWKRDAKDVPRKQCDTLVAQSRGRSIISSEFFDDLEPDVERRMVEDLGIERVAQRDQAFARLGFVVGHFGGSDFIGALFDSGGFGGVVHRGFGSHHAHNNG